MEHSLTSTKSTWYALADSIDRDSRIPYYIQVKKALLDHIESYAHKPGDQLPGEPELCRLFDVSRTVIRQTLREMEYEGFIRREKGRGTFVAEPKIGESLVQQLTGFFQDMVLRGHKPVTQVLKQGLIPATPRLASRLEVEVDSPVILIDRLRFIQDVPIVLVSTYLPFNLCREVLHADLTAQSLYTFLEEQCGHIIAYGRRTLEAVPANEYEADVLQVEKGCPLMMLDSVSYLSDRTPIEYYHALHRGDRARFEVELVRIREQGTNREVLGPPEEFNHLPRSQGLSTD